MSREAENPQGSLLCTRTWFPGEKEKAAKKGNRASGVQLGGLCWKPASQAKPESPAAAAADESSGYLLQDAQPKHCKHLLK